MLINLTASICFLIVLLIVVFDFFMKEKIKNIENNCFKVLSVFATIGLIIEVLMYGLIMLGIDMDSVILLGIGRLVFVYYVAFMFVFLLYVYTTCFDITSTKSKKYKKFILFESILYSIFLFLVLVLPFEFTVTDNYLYPKGAATNFSYLIGGFGILVVLIFSIARYKTLKTKKAFALYIGIALAIMSVVLQLNYHDLLLLIPSHAIAITMLYFAIENPDIKLLNEFHKAKEYANNLNAEKSEFLFNMAIEIKTLISVINRISKDVLMQDDINEIKENVKEIKYLSNILLELVNKVLDINEVEKRKVSVRESKYNPNNLFKVIVSQTEIKLKNNLVDFRVNYDETIPTHLYGDAVRIRQIVNTLIDNAIKYTKEGFIELSVNSIVKHDICRLIITIEDSGVGINQDKVEHLLDKDFDELDGVDNPKMNLGLVKTLLDLIGGTVIVNSELNRGTKFTIVLDQRIVNDKNKTIETLEKYEELYLNNKRVMLVVNDEKLSKKLNTFLKKYPIEIEVVKLGQICLEKIRNNEKFDLIVMEDNLDKLSHENTLKKLKDIHGFKTPVILLTRNSDVNEREEDLKLGFVEAITLPIKKEQVKELVNNYVLKD